MAFQVYLFFEDGGRDLVDEVDDLSDAAAFALNLANELGMKPIEGGRRQAALVELYQGDLLEISIHVMAGGLLGRKGDPKLRSM